MENQPRTGDVVRKVAGITLLGFLVVILIGPILTVLGVVLPFALVGLLVYIPYRMLVAGKQGGWPAVRETGRKALRTAAAFPIWLGERMVAFSSFVVRTAFRLVGTMVGLVFAVGAGAAIGATLGLIGGMEYHDAEMRVPAGALIGASVGFIVMVMRSKPSRVKLVRPAANAQHLHA
jgi:hypothetical protein